MRITLAYNERTKDTEEQGELITRDEMETIRVAIASLGHEVTPVEVSGPPEQIVDLLIASRPSLIFNIAEGVNGSAREARYPAIYETLGLAYTGGNPALLHVDLDKRLAEKVLEVRGVRVPHGAFLTPNDRELPEDLPFPVLIKPNYEGSSKGITKDSVAENPEQAREVIDNLLEDYPQGVVVEQFIAVRELTVPLLEAWPGRFLEIVEHEFDDSGEYNIFDYDTKHGDGEVRTICPPDLTPNQRRDVFALADRVDQVMPCPDLGRIDIRLTPEGKPYFLEVNPIPRLMHDGSIIVAAKQKGLAYAEVFDLVIRSAARRYGLSLAPKPVPQAVREQTRPTARELGVTVGRFPTGTWNAITDVEGVRVGHITHIEDDVPVPGTEGEMTNVRTGITAVCPHPESLFHEHMVAGAFVLNGIGEMAGITQAQEWGWLETPILLTNTMSVGRVHDGIIQHLVNTYPELGREVDVTIPLVGETNDAFLNDARIYRNRPEDAMKAIAIAKDGPVEQGSVGGGTGMLTFDFAGGIGSSSREIPGDTRGAPGYTVGVLVQSNFGNMRNLTVDGAVVGRELDGMFPYEGRRKHSYGSIIVVVATDAPLMTPQLNRLAKRAALGLGRAGSHAASTSGEIVFAFSTGNQVPRESKGKSRTLNLTYVTDEHINPLYEAVIEATEEAVLNAIFCSSGQTGRRDRYAPPVPTEKILELLRQGKPPAELRRESA